MLVHETGLAGARRFAACALREPGEARPQTRDPHVGKAEKALEVTRTYVPCTASGCNRLQ